MSQRKPRSKKHTPDAALAPQAEASGDERERPPAEVRPAEVSLRLRDLTLVVPDSSRSTRVLSAHKPFEARLALDLAADSNDLAFPVLCEVSVRARRLGSGETSITSEASRCIASAAEGAKLRCMGLPLPPGLYRFMATAAVSQLGDCRPRGVAYLDGGLIRVA